MLMTAGAGLAEAGGNPILHKSFAVTVIPVTDSTCVHDKDCKP